MPQLSLPFSRHSAQASVSLIGPRIRVTVIREPRPLDYAAIRGSSDVFALFKDEAARWDRERFLTLHLDNKNKLVGVEEVSSGSLTASIVHPREVFKGIILANAAAFIAVHNHPSGDPVPSREDIEITRRLKEGAELLGLRFLDHVIIGSGRYVSFVDDGYW